MPQVIDASKWCSRLLGLDHRSTAMLEGSYPLGFRLAPSQGSRHRPRCSQGRQLDLPVTTLVEQLELDLIQNGHGDEDASACTAEPKKAVR